MKVKFLKIWATVGHFPIYISRLHLYLFTGVHVMAMFSDGGVTSPDIWIVIFIIIIALISIVLNPLVFRHNFYKRKSIARDLYLALSVVDLLTCLVLPITFSIGILRPKEQQCFNDHNATFCKYNYYKYKRVATFSERLVGGVVWSLVLIPTVITSGLAMSRWYKISFPLRVLSKKPAEMIIIGISIVVLVVQIWNATKNSPGNPGEFKVNIQTTSFINYESVKGYLPLLMVVVFISTSTVASIFSVWKLVMSENVPGNPELRDKKIKSALKILLMQVGNCVIVVVTISRLLTNPKSEISLILHSLSCFLPVLLSSYNPSIYTLLTTNIFNPRT